jgi:flagellar basal-body rod protein FlgF
MQNALLVGLSRQVALSRELEIIANNIANIDTTSFKSDNALFAEYLMPGARDNDFAGRDRNVSFVQDRASWIDMSPGALQRTGNPLDVAIDGKGYFTIQTPRGIRYTRNGAFSIDATGNLVTGEGYQVLGTNGPIVFQNTDHNISISPTGIVTVREGNSTADAQRGQLQLAGFDQTLQKDGSTSFVAPDGVAPGAFPANSRLAQGSIEKSNVRPVVEMTRMIEITRNYSDIATILQQQGDLRKNALQSLSQIPTS